MSISRVEAFQIGAKFSIDSIDCKSSRDLGARLKSSRYPIEIREAAARCYWNLSVDDGMRRASRIISGMLAEMDEE